MLGAVRDDAQQRDPRGHLLGRRGDRARGVHRDVLRAVGAAHHHRPGRGAAAAVAAGTVDQGRRAFQHGLAAGAARAGVPPRRGARADRRGGLQQRDPVDQAAPGGVPGGDGRDRRFRPFLVRVRGRPAVRRHLRGGPAGHAHGLHPAQRAAALRGLRPGRGHLPAGRAARPARPVARLWLEGVVRDLGRRPAGARHPARGRPWVPLSGGVGDAAGGREQEGRLPARLLGRVLGRAVRVERGRGLLACGRVRRRRWRVRARVRARALLGRLAAADGGGGAGSPGLPDGREPGLVPG